MSESFNSAAVWLWNPLSFTQQQFINVVWIKTQVDKEM